MSMLFFLKPFHQFRDIQIPIPYSEDEEKPKKKKQRKRVYQVKNKARSAAVAKEVNLMRESRRLIENTIRQEAINRVIEKRRNSERTVLKINSILDMLDEEEFDA